MSIYIGNTKVADGLGGGGFNPPTNGDGKMFLSDDGTFKRIINDEAPGSENTAYSAKQTEARLEDIKSTIKASQDGSVNMWQKTTLNATANTPIVYTTDDTSSINKIIVQCYKFVTGQDNVVKILKEFNNADENNFYHTDNVEFNGVARIKDGYILENALNDDGLWESEVIDKNEFLILNGIEVV